MLITRETELQIEQEKSQTNIRPVNVLNITDE